jgi:hypothetical protein
LPHVDPAKGLRVFRLKTAQTLSPPKWGTSRDQGGATPQGLCPAPPKQENTSFSMAANDMPPGWSNNNASDWAERLAVLALGLTGFGIAMYLGLYQLDVVPVVREPLCGDGSHRILRESSIARLLPVPDGILGAVVYLLGATVNAIGSCAPWRTMRWIVWLMAAPAVSGYSDSARERSLMADTKRPEAWHITGAWDKSYSRYGIT